MTAQRRPAQWMVEFARLEPVLEQALAVEQTHSVEDVFIGIAEGRYQFWPMENSAGVTEVIHYPQYTMVHIFLAAGDMDELRGIEPEVAKWARSIHAHKIALTGRKGWARALKDKGYQEAAVLLAREV